MTALLPPLVLYGFAVFLPQLQGSETKIECNDMKALRAPE